MQKEKPVESAPIQIQLRKVNHNGDDGEGGGEPGDDGMMKKAVGRKAPPKLHKYDARERMDWRRMPDGICR